MPDDTDFNRLRFLISRSRQLKRHAQKLTADAAALDSRIQEALAVMRADVAMAEGKIDELEEEVRKDSGAESKGGSNLDGVALG
jgi:hypothetical protein